MTINARLDEIAKELVHNISTLDDRTTEAEIVEARHEARAALDKAIEVVLTAEPSDALGDAICKALNWAPNGTQNKIIEGQWHSVTFRELAKGYHRVIASALLEEIKNETPGS